MIIPRRLHPATLGCILSALLPCSLRAGDGPGATQEAGPWHIAGIAQAHAKGDATEYSGQLVVSSRPAAQKPSPVVAAVEVHCGKAVTVAGTHEVECQQIEHFTQGRMLSRPSTPEVSVKLLPTGSIQINGPVRSELRLEGGH